MSGARDTLEVVAGKINALIKKSDDQRITAGRLLVEAKERVENGEAGEINWSLWCRENVQRSEREIRRLIAIGNSGDPEAEAERQRQAAREGMQRTRAARTNVSPDTVAEEFDPTQGMEQAPPSSIYADLCAAWDLTTIGEQERFLKRIEARPAGDPVSLAIEAVQALAPEQLAKFASWFEVYCLTSEAPVEPAAPVEAEPAAPVEAEPAAPVEAEVDPENNRLYAMWSELKPNTQQRLIKWVHVDCPNEYPLIDDLPSMADSARPFRKLAARCSDDELEEFLSLVGSTERVAA